MQEIGPINSGQHISSSSSSPEQATPNSFGALANAKGWQGFFNLFHPPMTDPKEQAKLISNVLQVLNNQIQEQLKSALKSIRELKRKEVGN